MTDQNGPSPSPAARRTVWTRLLAALTGVVAGLVVVGVLYATKGPGKTGPVACRRSAGTIARLDPLVKGDVAALALTNPTRMVPTLVFNGPDGERRTLADFKGRTVLLNLWATWCVPCRKEMPALDRLQAKRGGPDFQVVTVNIDTARLDRPKAFLQDAGITNLPLYADPTAGVFQTLRVEGQALGLPTTLLIDPNGCQLGVMAGPAAWDSADADKLIEAAKAPAAPQG